MNPELERGDAGDPRQQALVGGQGPSLPVVHDQADVDAVLQRAQMHGVGEVITNVQREPMIERGHSGRHPVAPVSPEPFRPAEFTHGDKPSAVTNPTATVVPQSPFL
jgi:hypothetical protein